LLPALGRAKAAANRVDCVNNLKQLQVAWIAYAHDCNDCLALNTFVYLPGARGASVSTGWVYGNAWMDSNPDNIKKGQLFEYVRALRLYRCPADKSTVRDLGQSGRTRSYSLSCYMQSWPSIYDDYYPITWHKLAEIRKPIPTKAFTFLDEHESSIFWGDFFVNSPGVWTNNPGNLWEWVQFPATRHSNGANLAFADGHVDRWGWKEPNTPAISRQPPWLISKPAVYGTDRDLSRFFEAVFQR
jgi:prepilin-type processing-associated H-X9-DG protein